MEGEVGVGRGEKPSEKRRLGGRNSCFWWFGEYGLASLLRNGALCVWYGDCSMYGCSGSSRWSKALD